MLYWIGFKMLYQFLDSPSPSPGGGIRGRVLGDEKIGNVQDTEGRLYFVLLVHSLTRNSLDFVQ